MYKKILFLLHQDKELEKNNNNNNHTLPHPMNFSTQVMQKPSEMYLQK